MTDERPLVRCPGPEGQGCEAVLPITADWCYACGITFEGHELYLLYAERVGA